MKKLSLLDFKEYHVNQTHDTFILSTENQASNLGEDCIIANLLFHQMTILFNPNMIVLREGQSSVMFNDVKLVLQHDDECVLGDVFTVVAGDKKYTLIMR